MIVLTAEFRLAPIDKILALAQVKIDDVDTIHLLDVVVVAAAVNIFRHQFRGPKEDALKIGIFRFSLNFY